ncbi:MAG TPA: hypothetical protein VJS45_00530 [Acidimicrobiia bacterium]|nr:hypothetical protein [Acidimicrobiia bacterium]
MTHGAWICPRCGADVFTHWCANAFTDPSTASYGKPFYCTGSCGWMGADAPGRRQFVLRVGLANAWRQLRHPRTYQPKPWEKRPGDGWLLD